MVIDRFKLINQYIQKEGYWKQIDSTYKLQKANNDQYMANFQKIYEKQQSTISRLKFSKWLFIAIGLGGGYFLHK